MVSCKKPLAMFPKIIIKKKNSSIKTITKTKSDWKEICLQEEFLDDLDEMNEDQMNLLRDTELLKTIAITENDTDMKFCSNPIKEEQELIDIYNNMESFESKAKL